MTRNETVFPETELYLFADQANAELDLLRREYLELELRYDAAQERCLVLEKALDQSLAILANLEKALERKYVPILEAHQPPAPQWAL